MLTKKFQRESVSNGCQADPQGLMPKLSRGDSMELEHSANVASRTAPLNEEEGCIHDSSGLHVDVPLFAEATPERLHDVSAQQSLQSGRQDNVFPVFGDGQVDAIQNVEQEPPNFCTLGSRFEDVYCEASLMMNFGDVKTFYMRRHKRLKQCSAPPEGSLQISDQKPFVAGEMPDRTHTGEQADDKDTCLGNTSSNSEDKHLNNDLSLPSLDFSDSDPLQLKHVKNSTCQAKNTARWARELMQIGPFNEERTVMDIRDLSNTSRKRRSLQKISNSISNKSGNLVVKECIGTQNTPVLHKDAQRKWRDVDLSTTDPTQLIGCKCKVFWPEDKVWYTGVINGYNSKAQIHHVHYDDGDKEDLILAKELIKLYLSDTDMATQNLLEISELKKLDFQEMAALATDFQADFCHGEPVWAKIKGHPMWPAFVIDEKHADGWGLDAPVNESTLAVQFFGSYDYARINVKNAVSFSKGLRLKLFEKCKKVTFYQGLKEAERYLKEGKVPDIMSKLQEDALYPTQNSSQLDMKEDDQDFMGDERAHKTKKSVESLYTKDFFS